MTKKGLFYKFIRKHFPTLLGLVNKKIYRKRLAEEKQRKLDRCTHAEAYAFDDDGGDWVVYYCPTCKIEFGSNGSCTR